MRLKYINKCLQLSIIKKKRGGSSINSRSYQYQDVVAIEPSYGSAGGNTTRIYTRQGKTHHDNRRLQAVLSSMVAYYDADLDNLRKNYRTYLNCRQGIPLPLSPRLVLVPIKMRSVVSENDGATGYINLIDYKKVTTVEPSNAAGLAKCRIHLNGNHTLPSLFSRQNIEKRLAYGRQAHERHCTIKNNYNNKESYQLKPGNEEILEKLFVITTLYYELLTGERLVEKEPGLITKWLFEKENPYRQ